MRGIVEHEGLGVVGASWRIEDLAARINRLTAADVAAFKCRAHDVAEQYSATRNQDRFLQILAGLDDDSGRDRQGSAVAAAGAQR
jgi:hypothetical protein